MKTLIIKEEVTSFLDFEHSKIEIGKKETEFSEEFSDYIHKICEKALTNKDLKEIKVGKHNTLFECIEDDIEKISGHITKGFFAVGKQADIMPDASLITVRCAYNGEETIIAVKTDHKPSPYNSATKNDVKIIRKQLLPSQPKADEAIIINCEKKKIYILEKKYTIDNKNEYILNNLWIHGEALQTDNEKEKILKKILKEAEKEKPNDKYLPKYKSYMAQNAAIDAPVNMKEVVETVVGGYEADDYLEAAGIKDDEEIQNYSGNSKITITTDSGIKISIEADDFLENKFIEISNGEIKITGFENYKIS